MQQYFVDTIKENQAVIKGQDAHHIKNVMRCNIGDNIRVCCEGNCYIATIEELSKTDVLVALNKALESTELSLSVDIAQALIKREKFEMMLQKASELGVRNIIPISTKHAVVKINDNKITAKLSRWNTITKEACEQSERSHLTHVLSPVTINQLDFSSYDKVYLLYAREDNNQLKMDLSKLKNILIVIGPEGGFSKEEIDTLSNYKNVEVVSLGNRILRSETASIYMLSVINYLEGISR